MHVMWGQPSGGLGEGGQTQGGQGGGGRQVQAGSRHRCSESYRETDGLA